MTAPDVVELGRRAVAAMEARGIAWAPGMAGTAPTRSGQAGARWRVTLGSGGVLLCSEEGGGRGYTAMGPESVGLVPDFTDPATLGCLLALVREAWGEPTLSAAWAARRWYIVTPVRGVGFDALKAIDAPDELSALVAALEAAPVRS